jgi:tetratricopeptide (TPR) repeat protein
VARKGARVVGTPDDGRRRSDDRQRDAGGDRPDWEPEVWVDEPLEAETRTASASTTSTSGDARVRRRSVLRPAVPEEVQDELHHAVGAAQKERVHRRLAEAVKAYERDRYDDALRTLRPVARLAPMSPAVRELHGLTLYRLGRWAAALRELEAFHALTGSFDQYPVLIDCHRAAKHWRAAEKAWEDLRRASPPPDVLTEGRIAIAGARADQGDLAGAIEVLERASTKERRPPLHHLRLWYALADLYERAGDVPRARTLFRTVNQHDPTLFDTPQRLSALA